MRRSKHKWCKQTLVRQIRSNVPFKMTYVWLFGCTVLGRMYRIVNRISNSWTLDPEFLGSTAPQQGKICLFFSRRFEYSTPKYVVVKIIFFINIHLIIRFSTVAVLLGKLMRFLVLGQDKNALYVKYISETMQKLNTNKVVFLTPWVALTFQEMVCIEIKKMCVFVYMGGGGDYSLRRANNVSANVL